VKEWLRARRAGWCAGAIAALAATAGLAAGNLPSLNLLYRNSEGAPLRLVIPALAATGTLTALISPTPRAELTSARVGRHDAALMAGLVGGALVLAEGMPAVMGTADHPFTFTRNLVGFFAIGLIARSLLPATIAALIPLAWMIPTLTLARPEGDLIAWPLLIDGADPRGIGAAVVLLGIGFVAEVGWTRQRPQRTP
jgi:hypothetical protein